MKRVLVLLLALGLAVILTGPMAFAVPPEKDKPEGVRFEGDDLPNPLAIAENRQ